MNLTPEISEVKVASAGSSTVQIPVFVVDRDKPLSPIFLGRNRWGQLVNPWGAPLTKTSETKEIGGVEHNLCYTQSGWECYVPNQIKATE